MQNAERAAARELPSGGGDGDGTSGADALIQNMTQVWGRCGASAGQRKRKGGRECHASLPTRFRTLSPAEYIRTVHTYSHSQVTHSLNETELQLDTVAVPSLDQAQERIAQV